RYTTSYLASSRQRTKTTTSRNADINVQIWRYCVVDPCPNRRRSMQSARSLEKIVGGLACADIIGLWPGDRFCQNESGCHVRHPASHIVSNSRFRRRKIETLDGAVT